MAELYSVRMRAAQGGPHEKGGHHALAVPGMIFTVIMAPVFVKVFRKIHSHVPKNDLIKGKVS